MAKRKNIRTAGRLVTGVIYTVAHQKDTEQARADKTQMSSIAREKINLRYSWQKLEALLAANFAYSHLMVTLTYDDDHLPDKRDCATKTLQKVIRTYREYRRDSTGEALAYIYVTEGSHGDRRLHHHMVLNAVTSDIPKILELWPYGNVDFQPLGKLGYTKTAHYLTKEPRERGKWTVGERTWVPSIGLKRPIEDKGWVPDNYSLTPPPGAHILHREPVQNEWGEYTYIKYLLPEPAPEWPAQFQRPRPLRKTDRI